MKKVIISQPMSDKTKEEILEIRAKAIESAKNKLGEDIEIIDSYIQDAPEGVNALWFLGKFIQLLSEADYMYLAPGWEDYRGCRVERLAAIEYCVEIIHG